MMLQENDEKKKIKIDEGKIWENICSDLLQWDMMVYADTELTMVAVP